jgi:hypothetical protein
VSDDYQSSYQIENKFFKGEGSDPSLTALKPQYDCGFLFMADNYECDST